MLNAFVGDPLGTRHPELKLARWAARSLTPEVAAGTTMLTSCRPCGMCVGAIERSVPQEGPALVAEATVPVEGYYR